MEASIEMKFVHQHALVYEVKRVDRMARTEKFRGEEEMCVFVCLWSVSFISFLRTKTMGSLVLSAFLSFSRLFIVIELVQVQKKIYIFSVFL